MAESLKLIPVKMEPAKLVSDFSELYCNVISDLYTLKSRQFLGSVRRAVKDIRRLKHEINERHEIDFYADIKFEIPAERCAYMYSYSVLNTVIVYSEFLKYLKENKEIYLPLFSKKTLKICCLAGGPATEAVALSKAISDFIGKFSSDGMNFFMDVHVTVVDICSEWKSEEEALIKALNKNSSLFSSERIHFHADFLEVDLLKPFQETLKEKIKEANIITVIKFANSILERSGTCCISPLENMMKSVVDCMEENSCLFVLDTAGGNAFSHLSRVISKHRNSFKLQQSLHKEYRLHPKTLQKMESSMDFRNFAQTSVLFPTRLTKISSCIWIKETVMEKKPKEKKPKEKTPKEETSKEETPKQKTPKEKTPKEKKPKEKIPKEKTPKEKKPKEKIPKEKSKKNVNTDKNDNCK